MDPSSIRTLLLNLAIAAVIIAVCLGASWLLAMLRPGLIRVLEETRAAVLRVRTAAGTAAGGWIKGRQDAARASMRREPLPAVALQLARVADATETVGERQLSTVARLEERLGASVDRLGGLSVPAGEAPSLNVERLKAAAESTTGALWKSILVGLLLVVFVAINSLVLIEFFTAVFSDRPLLPYPLPAFTIGHVFAAAFALAEVGAGMIAHRKKKKADSELTLMDSIASYAPYLVLFSLATIELFAYAVLSVNIRMPERLGIPATSAFYDTARYFFAIFGPALTLLLAALGYTLWESVAEFWSGRNAKKVLTLFSNYDQMSKSAEKRVNAVTIALGRLREEAQSLPGSVRAAFVEAIGAPKEENLAVAETLRKRTEDLLDPTLPARHPARDERAAIAVTVMNVVFLALWGLLAFVFYQAFATVLASAPTGWALAIAITLIVAVLGIGIKDASVGAPYASLVHTAIPSRLGRRIFVYFLTAVLVVGAVVSAWVAIRAQMLGPTPLLNAVLGILLVAAIAALSVNIDSGMVSAGQLIGWLTLSAAWLLLALYLGGTYVFEALLYFAGQTIKLAAAPGEWVRERFRNVPAAAVAR